MTPELAPTAQVALPVAAIKALRPKQWTKNGVLFVPLLFAKGIFREGLLTKSALGVVAFCLLASGVYLVNDWFDREKDRLHPEKKHRPIAAGQLGGVSVVVLLAACWGGAGAISWYVGRPFFTVAVAYVVLQLFYTTLLKHMVILDVL